MFYQDITIYLHIIYSHWNNGKNESLRQCLIHKSENSYNFTLYRKVLLTSAIKQQKLISHLNRVPKCLKASLGQLCSIGYLGVMPPNQYALLHLSRWKKNREGCPSAIKCFCPSVTHWASHWPKQLPWPNPRTGEEDTARSQGQWREIGPICNQQQTGT